MNTVRMNTTDQRIIFMGTPEFAVGTLNALVSAGFNVAAVVTAPDKPAGRGRQMRGSAVKERALELNIPVLQPPKLKDPAFLDELDRINASLYVVVAFRMLPEVVWNRPKYGTVNLHGSLLPDYRGAAPINWAVINGERTTGVTTFKIQHAIDTGDILLQEPLEIGPDETAGELHDRMMEIGATLMVRTVHGLFNNSIVATPQVIPEGREPRIAPKIGPELTRIHFNGTARNVHDLVRGMSPFPGAWCQWQSDNTTSHFKVLRTRLTETSCTVEPGTVRIVEGAMQIACSDQWIEAEEVQAEGKRRMNAKEFVRGLRSDSGISLL